MYKRIFFVAIVLGVITANSGYAEKISYSEHIKPIIDKKCVVCHACFDAPCQLVLTHAEGFQRGANKQPVYDGTRASPAEPTRLFIDARTILEWRERNFFAVLPEGKRDDSAPKNTVLEQMILLHGTHDFKPNSRLPEAIGLGLKRHNECPSSGEIDAYKKAFPHGGMPLGVTGLTDSERQNVLYWISQGAPMDPPAVRLSAQEQREIQTWEQFLNHKSSRRQLLARWMYEHLFIAHLYFSGLDSENFFQVVRSRTPPGKPVELIATRRPNDDPQQPFFYRLQPVREKIVYKTHVTFALDEGLLNRINTLFLKDGWGVERLPGYSDEERSNPFKTFAPIPARARYRFMLEHAEYFVQTYIKGPVCHGQIATDVIRDQFWVIFQAPESDLYVTSGEYRKQSTPYMDIAGVEQDLLEGAKTWFSVKTQYDRYSQMRQTAYEQPYRSGADLRDIWDGGGTNSNALLTVFRHHDNASVRKGLIGDYPLTVWWMDFPLFERGYYNLVVNFDVFGSVAHQAQTRLYFDLIRNDAERNFLRLMPATARRVLMDEWYEGAAQLKLMTSYQEVSDKMPPRIRYQSDDPKRELLDRLLERLTGVNARPDDINRSNRSDREQRKRMSVMQRSERALRRIAARKPVHLPVVKFFPDVSFVRVSDRSGQREIYTVIRNRMHSNVAFMFGESLRYKPNQDTLTVYPGVLASYPNFMFNVRAEDIDAFVNTLSTVKDERKFEETVVKQWGVRRTHPRFWDLFHDLTVYLEEHTPTDAGVMDMSRYENL